MPGLYMEAADGTAGVVGFTVDGGRITAIDLVRNPAKIRLGGQTP
jgi:RNA polymerase sigma-70 factor, ECF subfamily